VKIIQITPAKKTSKSGNRTTADRWGRIFSTLGHHVVTQTDYDGQSADLMVALHAWRSADAIDAFKSNFPERPIVLALTGTDINEFIHTHPEATLKSMALADALVCLHDLVVDLTPKKFRNKLHVIYQSAKPLTQPRSPAKRTFDVCVIGHMRDVKDPLRTAFAAREMPADSKIRVIHLGKAHNADWAKKATAEMKRNPRFLWKGEVSGAGVRREFAKTHLMVISSLAEGGANVVSEALVAGVPIIASDISGNVGLLGRDYPGYYPVEDTGKLTELLMRAENDPKYLKDLTRRCKARAKMFRPEAEQKKWKQVLADFR